MDGRFGTRKEHPGDFDACWDVRDVDDEMHDPVFWDFSRGRVAQKLRFLGELFPAQLPEGATGMAFVDFFQVNKMSGEPKGILAIRLGRSRRKRSRTKSRTEPRRRKPGAFRTPLPSWPGRRAPR